MEDFSDLGLGEGWLGVGLDTGSMVEYVLLWVAFISLIAWGLWQARQGRVKAPADTLFGLQDGKRLKK